jgi:hypothetical protein
MHYRSEKGICFNCDNKYNKRHECSDNKLFYLDYEEEEEQELEPSLSKKGTTPTIPCHDFSRISTP